MNEPQNKLVKSEPRTIEFTPFGAQDKIKLSVEIVKNFIAVKTKSGKTCTDSDALKFIMLCQAQRLNPFAGDAYLIGYDSQGGANFSLITAHQAFLKRAEASDDFLGMESGIIIQDESGVVSERAGDFHLTDEKIVGGWARVHHRKREKFPTYRRIRMERFNKGFAQWREDPAGMIVKCAEADALRSTFPTLLGGMFLGEEKLVHAEVTSSPLDTSKLVALAPVDSGNSESVQPAPHNESPPADESQKELAAFVTDGGFTFDHLQKWGTETGNIPDADSLPSFADIPSKICKRLLLAKNGLLKGLEAVKEGK